MVISSQVRILIILYFDVIISIQSVLSLNVFAPNVTPNFLTTFSIKILLQFRISQ